MEVLVRGSTKTIEKVSTLSLLDLYQINIQPHLPNRIYSIRKTKKPSREEENVQSNHEDQQLNINSSSPNQRRFSSARKGRIFR